MGRSERCAIDQKEWRALVDMLLNEFHFVIFAWPCVLSDHPFVLWCVSPKRSGMPLRDAVTTDCKKGATTENQGTGVKYMG